MMVYSIHVWLCLVVAVAASKPGDMSSFFLKAPKSVPRAGRAAPGDYEGFFLKTSKSVPRIGRRNGVANSHPLEEEVHYQKILPDIGSNRIPANNYELQYFNNELPGNFVPWNLFNNEDYYKQSLEDLKKYKKQVPDDSTFSLYDYYSDKGQFGYKINDQITSEGNVYNEK